MKSILFNLNYNNNVKGIILIILSSFFFSLMAFFVKLSSSNLSILEIIFFRSFLGIIIIAFIINTKKIFFKTQILHLHFIRTIISLISMYLMFYSISKLPLSNVSIVSFAKIFFIIPLAFFFLKEKINFISLAFIILGYLGVLIVIGFDNDSKNTIYYLSAVLATFMIALVKVFIKKISEYDDAFLIQFWFSLIVFLILFLPYVSAAKMVSPKDLFYVTATSVTGLFAQYFSILGLKKADANTVMPFDFSRVVFGIILGVIFFNEKISPSMLSGLVLLLFSVCSLGYMHSRSKIKLVDKNNN